MTIVLNGTTGITTPTTSSTGEFVTSVTGFKNRIINGAMVIDQRNAGASQTPTNGAYMLDRYAINVSQTSKLTQQQNAGAVTPPAGFIKYMGFTSSSAYSVLTGDYFAFYQAIEGLNVADFAWGTASAVTVTLSFWVRSSLTGAFGGSLRNGTAARSYPFSYTINTANTWEQKTVTIAGDTSGTWSTDNGVGMLVGFSLGAGSTFNGTVNAWGSANYLQPSGSTSVVGTNGATFYITGVQLEKGSTATSFDYRPYGTELALCQRYYYRISGSAGRQGVGYAKTTTTADVAVSFPVTMRTNPSALEQSGTASDYLLAYQNTATACSSVPTFTNASVILGVVNYTVSAVLTAGNGLTAGANSANSYLGWSAEL